MSDSIRIGLSHDPAFALRDSEWIKAHQQAATTEFALAAFRNGDPAELLRRAERGVELAADFASVRHRVKSAVVLAAARCAAGDLDGAREGADAALTDTETHGLVPLRWALASLLAGIGSSRPPERIAEIRDTAAALVTSRGGHWHP